MSSSVADDKPGKVVVSGSMCFDLIMKYDGLYQEHFLPEHLDNINLSFLVNNARKERGGCSGNIGYSMALLGEHPRLVASVGPDFESYGAFLRQIGVDTDYIKVFADEMTATCTISSDRANRQITFVCTAAMSRARELDLRRAFTEHTRYVMISPDDPLAMNQNCEAARQCKIPFIYDPSFQVIAFDGEQLLRDASGAYMLLVNDYEFELFLKKTGLDLDGLRRHVNTVVVTCGEKGSIVHTQQETLQIAPIRVAQVAEPTGAGDAFRGGLLFGLVKGCDVRESAQIGSVCGAYAVECVGTQNYHYTPEEFCQRYKEHFEKDISRLFA
ncbi:MAG: carbohydrate kinase family protein [bacterium]|nr:carbohydrate kinase family protein [bacterium]